MSLTDMNAHKMALMKAINVGNVEEAREIMTDDDLHMNDASNSILHHVCSPQCDLKTRRKEMLEMLVQRGADVNLKNADGDGALHLCIDTHDLECVEFLIAQGVKVDDLGKDGSMTTTRAARNGDKAILAFLFKNNATVNFNDSLGRTVLHQIFCLPPFLASENMREIVEILIEIGCDINAGDESLNRPLHYAAMSGCMEGVAFFIEKGVDLDALNKDKQTALAKAAWRGEIDTMTALINAGAHVNKIDGHCNSVMNNACDVRAIHWDSVTNDYVNQNEGCTTKEQWVIKEKKECCILKLIGDKMVDVNFPNIIGMSPLMNATKGGLVSVVKALVEANADVLKRDINGRTALHHVFRDNTNTDVEIQMIVELLRQYKGKTNQLDKFGNAPIHYAIMYTPHVIEQPHDASEVNEKASDKTRLEHLQEKRGGIFKLLENGSEPNIVGRGGNTALHLACKYDKSEKYDCIRILRYFKADNSLVNNIGQTPLNIAQQSGKQELVDVLTKNMDFSAPENKQDVCCTIL